MSFALPAAADRVTSPGPVPRVRWAASADHRCRVVAQAQNYTRTTGPVIPFRTLHLPVIVAAQSPAWIVLAATFLLHRGYKYHASPHHRGPIHSIYVPKRTVSPL